MKHKNKKPQPKGDEMTLLKAREEHRDVFFLPSMAAAEEFARTSTRTAVAFAEEVSHCTLYCVAVAPRPRPVIKVAL